MNISPQQKWPDWVCLVRHGQSAGNVAAELAESQGLSEITIEATRDMDVPLSSLGEQQADALAAWFGKESAKNRPTVVLCSPYLRAKQTAERIMTPWVSDELKIPIVIDERLREREFGLIDRLTGRGIREKFPLEAEAYHRVKKFYYRPPGGESWCDVILRLRSVVDSLSRDYRGERVLIVAHAAVVLCFRYLFERMTEEQILSIDRTTPLANCGVTRYLYDPSEGVQGGLALEIYNSVAPMAAEGAPVTSDADIKV